MGVGDRPCEHVRPDRDRHVRAFTGHSRAIRTIHPLPADLAEGVRPALRRCSIVGVCARPPARLGVEHRSERREEALARLGIEVAVDAHHAPEGYRGV